MDLNAGKKAPNVGYAGSGGYNQMQTVWSPSHMLNFLLQSGIPIVLNNVCLP